MSFKDKFHVNPQHDSEGFTMQDAKCHGCGPADMCPRSGHCERYDSPLRYANAHLDGLDMTPVPSEVQKVVAGILLANPPGWNEVDGVTLPRITWATSIGEMSVSLDKLSDEQLELAFQLWLHSSTKPEARKVEQRQEITAMLQRFNAQGVEPLSDSRAPDVFVGRR